MKYIASQLSVNLIRRQKSQFPLNQMCNTWKSKWTQLGVTEYTCVESLKMLLVEGMFDCFVLFCFSFNMDDYPTFGDGTRF